MDDVIEMAKHGLAARAPLNDSFSILKKHQGNIVINSDATARNEVFTDVQVNLSGEGRCTSSPHHFCSDSISVVPPCQDQGGMFSIGITEFGSLNEVVDMIGSLSMLVYLGSWLDLAMSIRPCAALILNSRVEFFAPGKCI